MVVRPETEGGTAADLLALARGRRSSRSRTSRAKRTRVAAPAALHGAAPEGPEEACARMDVHRVLDQLGPDDRLVLSLFYVSDLPVVRIAEMLSIPEGAVRTRLSRARPMRHPV